VRTKPFVTGDRITIERFARPVFITAGSYDKVWSVDRTRRLEQTLRRAGRDVAVHVFPGEGHGFSTAAEQRRRELVLRFLDRVFASP
jgi:dipeptidyl aminopeptidase/acylaminoacyl peptidase